MVVIGGGFGGLQVVRKLRGAPVEITLIDRRNFHLFQPLVYQVATGSLSAEEVASPLRSIFKRNRNVHVVLGEVTGLDLAGRSVIIGGMPNGGEPRAIPYDSLVVAAGVEVHLLRTRRLAPVRARHQVGRERPRGAPAHPDRVRGRRQRARSGAPRGLADVRDRRRGPDRGRARRSDRRARPALPAQGLPRRRHQRRADPARRDGRPRAAAVSPASLRSARAGRSSGSGSRC